MSDDDLLAEQRAFYRARAPEYDEWWQRRGAYERDEAETAEWRAQVGQVEAAVRDFNPTGDVLELAGGTGWWTWHLAQTAGRLTVVDASPETIELNRRRVAPVRGDVDYVVADVFDWRPDRQYDVVFFSFWLSHVPRPRLPGFWSLVRDALKPAGRVMLIDNRHDAARSWPPDPYVFDHDSDVQRRRLKDGSEYRVVKVFYEPDDLDDMLRANGFDGQAQGTRWFVWATGSLR